LKIKNVLYDVIDKKKEQKKYKKVLKLIENKEDFLLKVFLEQNKDFIVDSFLSNQLAKRLNKRDEYPEFLLEMLTDLSSKEVKQLFQAACLKKRINTVHVLIKSGYRMEVFENIEYFFFHDHWGNEDLNSWKKLFQTFLENKNSYTTEVIDKIKLFECIEFEKIEEIKHVTEIYDAFKMIQKGQDLLTVIMTKSEEAAQHAIRFYKKHLKNEEWENHIFIYAVMTGKQKALKTLLEECPGICNSEENLMTIIKYEKKDSLIFLIKNKVNIWNGDNEKCGIEILKKIKEEKDTQGSYTEKRKKELLKEMEELFDQNEKIMGKSLKKMYRSFVLENRLFQ
jgi:hypothetical protein